MNSLPAALRIGFLCCQGFSYITTGQWVYYTCSGNKWAPCLYFSFWYLKVPFSCSKYSLILRLFNVDVSQLARWHSILALFEVRCSWTPVNWRDWVVCWVSNGLTSCESVLKMVQRVFTDLLVVLWPGFFLSFVQQATLVLGWICWVL